MGRIFKNDGPFLLQLISALGVMTWAWSWSFGVYLLIMLLLLALEPAKRAAFPVEQRWKMAAAIVTVAAGGIALQRSANNAIRRRKIRTLSGQIQPASQPPSPPTVGFWLRVRKL